MGGVQYLPTGAGSKMGWHRDGDFIRLTYLLQDCPPDAGRTAFIPGSHTSTGDHLQTSSTTPMACLDGQKQPR